jgi:hypothetical protein
MKNSCKIVVANPEGKRPLGNVGINEDEDRMR